MNDSVERLTQVLPGSPGGHPKDWASATERLGTELPSDYVEFIEKVGGGYLDSYLYVLEPDCANDNYDLVDSAQERTEAFGYLWDDDPCEEKPSELDEPGARLIPWASTDNGEFVYWLVRPGQHPDDWTIMINEARGDWWERLDMGFARFLLSTLTGQIRAEILTDDFPTSPHTFRPFADPSWQA
ncbi:SMI1/KNR4 family protein [Kitasatospora sp. NPDC056138]|uniref:SMI1/KNR4 family protein n=1 Tax=Kitasatospora sp. NPDC056138 TaxID=3345724 RepID=UPI0035DD2E32